MNANYKLQVAGDNVDDVRGRMMALEGAAAFDERAWLEVIADLAAAGRISAVGDARRRMETARAVLGAVLGADCEADKRMGADGGRHRHAIVRPLLGRAYCEVCLREYGAEAAVAVAVETVEREVSYG